MASGCGSLAGCDAEMRDRYAAGPGAAKEESLFITGFLSCTGGEVGYPRHQQSGEPGSGAYGAQPPEGGSISDTPEINMMSAPVIHNNRCLSIIETRPDVVCHKGRCLYGANEPFRGLFVIISGAIKHYRLTEDGEEMVTGFCLPGEWCGLPDLSSGRYTGYALALDTSTVRMFPPDTLTEIMAEQPGRQYMYLLMSDVIRKNKVRYYQLSKVHADVRLAMFIQDLSRRFSQLGYSPREFRLPMTRGDIANYLGMVPETISREITRLEKGGIICLNHRFIKVQSLDKLKEFISQA